MLKSLLSFVFIWISFFVQAQQIEIFGKVTDSLSNPIVFTNVLAEISDKSNPMKFAMTDEQGRYKIKLLSNKTYVISFLSMGYYSQKKEIKTDSSNILIDIVLRVKNENLDQVTITAQQSPVVVTKDSIAYKTDKFVNGSERKLKDVLKKLPGVQLRSNGTLTVMGKKVTKILVDGKSFFGGDSKLAINNIPANAVKKVVAIKDYTSVGFMKGLTDEQKMVINIKLKKGKKHFVFGDIEAGAEIHNNHLAKADIFYYSPKTNISYLGNHNNIGELPLTYTDLNRLENNDNNLTSTQFIHQTNNDIKNLLKKNDYTQQTNKFHAIQWQQDFGNHIAFNIYGLKSINEARMKQENNRIFLNNNLSEKTIKNDNILQDLSFAKLKFRYKPTPKQFIEYQFSYKDNNSEHKELINSTIQNFGNDYINNKFLKAYTLIHSFGWHQKFSKKHTLRLIANYENSLNNTRDYWETNENDYINHLPIETQNIYRISQNVATDKINYNFEIKEFYKINGKNHIYTSIGGKLTNNHFFSNTFQLLDNQNVNNFSNADFGNNNYLNFSDYYIGLQYKFRWHKTTFKPGLFLHKMTWKYTGDIKKNQHKLFLLPDFVIKSKINYKSNIKLKYRLNTRLPAINNNAKFFVLNNLNDVVQGNETIENECFHHFSLDYDYFKLSSGIMLFANINYDRKIKSIYQNVFISGINTLTKLNTTNTPENTINTVLFFRKDFNKFYLQFNSITNFDNTIQFINHNAQDITNFFQSYNIGLGLSSKKINSFLTGIILQQNKYYLSETIEYNTVVPYLKLDIPYKSWIFKSNFSYKIITNKPQYDYKDASISIAYQKDNQPFRFEIAATNIFNSGVENNYYFNDYYQTYNKTYRQPAMFVFKINYNL